MKVLIYIFLLLIGTAACHQTEELPVAQEIRGPVLEDGTYVGHFIRSSPNTKWQAATVTLTFEKNKFTGSSSINHYPAICNGTYESQGQEILFSNACFWTADFDWTFILNGKFTLTKAGPEITLTRNFSGNIVDTYRLVKK